MGKIQGKVTKVETKDFNSKALGAMQSHKITVESADGTKATANKSTKKSTGFTLPIGTDVSMEYQDEEVTTDSGTFVTKRVVQNGLVLLNQKKETNYYTTASSTSTYASIGNTTTDWAAKDLSMEVSGLLQAIIQHHGFDKTTGTKLREALTLKRQVASEFREGSNAGSVKNETSKKKETISETTGDDSCPFDLTG